MASSLSGSPLTRGPAAASGPDGAPEAGGGGGTDAIDHLATARDGPWRYSIFLPFADTVKALMPSSSLFVLREARSKRCTDPPGTAAVRSAASTKKSEPP